MSLTGITGTHLADMEEPRAQGGGNQGAHGGKLPVAVGFGIRTPGDAARWPASPTASSSAAPRSRSSEKAVAAKRDPVPELAAFVRSLRDALGGPQFELLLREVATGDLLDMLPPGPVVADGELRTLAYGAQLWCAR